MLIFIVIVFIIVIVNIHCNHFFTFAAESSSQEKGRVELKGGEEGDIEDDGEEEEEEEQMVKTTQTTLTTLDQKSHQISTVECLNGKTSVL